MTTRSKPRINYAGKCTSKGIIILYKSWGQQQSCFRQLPGWLVLCMVCNVNS